MKINITSTYETLYSRKLFDGQVGRKNKEFLTNIHKGDINKSR